jgi:hypothetical protein
VDRLVEARWTEEFHSVHDLPSCNRQDVTGPYTATDHSVFSTSPAR